MHKLGLLVRKPALRANATSLCCEVRDTLAIFWALKLAVSVLQTYVNRIQTNLALL